MQSGCSYWLELLKEGHVGIIRESRCNTACQYESEVAVALEFIGLGILR
jgi:hypothetical protein